MSKNIIKIIARERKIMLPQRIKNVKIKVRNQYGGEYVLKCESVYIYEPQGLNRNPQFYYHVFNCTVTKSNIEALPKKIAETWLPKSAEILK